MARVLAAVFYLGLAPLLCPRGLRRDEPFVRHHATQALIILLLLLALLAGVFLCWALLSYVIVYHRQLYERLPGIEGWSAPARDALVVGIVLAAWLLVWFSGLVLALRGSVRPLPFVARLACRPRLVRLAYVGNTLCWVGGLLTAVLALHASSLTRDDDDPAPVYLLYDDMGIVPRWVFNLGCCRVSRAATARWGPGSVVVGPLDEHHLRLALRHGRLVILACHGREGDIESPHLRVVPSFFAASGCEETPPRVYVASLEVATGLTRWTPLEVGPSLRFVYNSACEGGYKAAQWERALAPAQVRTFDRLSAVAEHVVWLWFDGPDQVRSLE
jgi:uncharacterized membrane protein